MKKNIIKNGKLIVIGIAVAVFFLNTLLVVTLNSSRNQKEGPIATESSKKEISEFSYPGEEGKDALTLLKETTGTSQDASGLVVSINGRKADSNKREFWAFYVNDKQASVGPSDYITKDADRILWKIEQY